MASEEHTDNSVPNLLFSGSTESSFACNACKKKKIKCNRIAPRCSNCEKSGRSCEYPLSVPKPGPKAGFASRKRQVPHTDTDGDEAVPLSGLDSGTVTDSLNNTLTEIVHPRHHSPGASQLESESRLLQGQLSPGSENGAALAQALKSLRITWHDCQLWIGSYFEHMTAFSLFHRPTFEDKLMSLTNADEVEALLTAIIAFAKPFGPLGEPSAMRNLPAAGIWDRARYLVRDCLDEYANETPPLHLLQTLLLTTWNQLYKGVRSRGWRALGECVRICYEMRLHQEDDDKPSSRSWIEREERRRAWWAAWELDVFASTMKRLPTSISWNANRTKLPMPDPSWYGGVGGSSCYFLCEPSERWKVMEQCGNDSGQSWFVIMNSYKYEAFLLLTNPQSCALQFVGNGPMTPETVRKYRDMLINCVHCAHLAMPEKLSIQGRFLGFRPASRIDDSWRYTIHLMLQVTKFMLYRLDVFFRPKVNRAGGKAAKTDNSPSKLAWEQFIASGDETVKVLRNSAADHVKWINPCVANAVWFGAAALVVGQVLGPNTVDRPLLSTNFDLLRATVREYTRVSKVPETLLTSLDTLEGNLRALTEKTAPSLPQRSPISASETTRSPQSLAESNLSRWNSDSDTMSGIQSPPVPLDSAAQVPTDKDLDFLDTSGLDMTQSFNDIDELWATTIDWNFNLDCFRIPYE